MNRNAGWLGVFAVMLGAMACTPSPEKVCDKMMELKKETNPLAKTFCVPMMKMVKEKAPDSYKCMAKCVMAASAEADLDNCKKTCPKPAM